MLADKQAETPRQLPGVPPHCHCLLPPTVQGYEYLICGLQTAATTHWLYDWAAMVFLVKEWQDGGDGGALQPLPGAAAPNREGEQAGKAE